MNWPLSFRTTLPGSIGVRERNAHVEAPSLLFSKIFNDVKVLGEKPLGVVHFNLL